MYYIRRSQYAVQIDTNKGSTTRISINTHRDISQTNTNSDKWKFL